MNPKKQCYFCRYEAIAIHGEVPRCEDHMPAKDPVKEPQVAFKLEMPKTPTEEFIPFSFPWKTGEDLT